VICWRCKESLRGPARYTHARCQLSALAADDILIELRLRLGAPVQRLADDFGLTHYQMTEVLRAAARRRRQMPIRKAS